MEALGLQLSAFRIVVDELMRWPTKIACFKHGSCHLAVEPDDAGQCDLDRLHAFARSIGLSWLWFQDHRLMPHYDLTPSRRALALTQGATFVPWREQVRRRWALRRIIGQAQQAPTVAAPSASNDFFNNFVK